MPHSVIGAPFYNIPLHIVSLSILLTCIYLRDVHLS